MDGISLGVCGWICSKNVQSQQDGAKLLFLSTDAVKGPVTVMVAGPICVLCSNLAKNACIRLLNAVSYLKRTIK